MIRGKQTLKKQTKKQVSIQDVTLSDAPKTITCMNLHIKAETDSGGTERSNIYKRQDQENVPV